MNINNNLIWDNIDWNEINLFINVNDNITMNREWKIKMYKNDH